jgi:septal ring factor EnvC (AmiA/AmiB activator)
VEITDTNNLIWEDGMSDLRDIATLCKEIDCLTNQIDTLRKERANIGDWIDLTKLCKEIDDLTAQVETLHKERNEARQELCRWSSFYYEDHIDMNEGPPLARDIEEAERRGWDCFKENQ